MENPVTEADVVELLAAKSLAVVFQPLWHIASARVIGFEALARFPHGDPAEWFRVARACGREDELDLLAVERALAAFADAEKLPDAWLFTNVDTPLASGRAMLALVRAWPRTVLELTGRVRLSESGLDAALSEFGREGVALAVDDVGGALGDPQQLRLVAPEFVKLERHLVWRLCRDEAADARVAVREYCELAEEIGAEVLAEGVEELTWLPRLHTLGVHYAQGYVLGRPEPLPAYLRGTALATIAARLRALGLGERAEGDAPRRELATFLERERGELLERLTVSLAPAGKELAGELLDLFAGLVALEASSPLLPAHLRRLQRRLAASPEALARGAALLRPPLEEVGRRRGLSAAASAVAQLEVDRLQTRLWRERLRRQGQEAARRSRHQSVSERYAHMRALAREMLRERDAAKLYELLARAARAWTDADVAVVSAFGADSVRVVVPSEGEGELRAGAAQHLLERGVEGAVLTTGWPYRATAADRGRAWPGAPGTTGFGSVLAVPLPAGRGRRGVVSVWRLSARAFGEEDEQLLSALALDAAELLDVFADLRQRGRREEHWLALDGALRAMAYGRPRAEAAALALRALADLAAADVALWVELEDDLPVVRAKAGESPRDKLDALLALLPCPAGMVPLQEGGEMVVAHVPRRGEGSLVVAARLEGARLGPEAWHAAERVAFLLSLVSEEKPGPVSRGGSAGGEEELAEQLRALAAGGAKALLVFLRCPLEAARSLVPPEVELYSLNAWVVGLCRSGASDVRAHVHRALRLRQVRGEEQPEVRYLVWEGEGLADLLARLGS